MIALPPAWGKHGPMTGMPLTGRPSPGSALSAFATVAERAHDDGGRGGVRTALWPRLELSLEPDFEAARRAREALEELDGHVEDDVLDDMRLLVTELVTNSVRHADAGPDEPVRLEVTVDHGRVLVAVEDGGNGFRPRRPVPAPLALAPATAVRPGGERRVVLHDLEPSLEARDLEYALNDGGAAHERQAPALLPRAGVGGDQGAQAGRVEEGEAAQVEEDVGRSLALDLLELRVDGAGRGDIELAIEREAYAVVLATRLALEDAHRRAQSYALRVARARPEAQAGKRGGTRARRHGRPCGGPRRPPHYHPFRATG